MPPRAAGQTPARAPAPRHQQTPAAQALLTSGGALGGLPGIPQSQLPGWRRPVRLPAPGRSALCSSRRGTAGRRAPLRVGQLPEPARLPLGKSATPRGTTAWPLLHLPGVLQQRVVDGKLFAEAFLVGDAE